jgi:23S rRNA C2498 (ribose-2'-O)-methylase RlmM
LDQRTLNHLTPRGLVGFFKKDKGQQLINYFCATHDLEAKICQGKLFSKHVFATKWLRFHSITSQFSSTLEQF